MTILLEFKEQVRSFYGKYARYLLPVIKFLLAAVVFWQIRERLGYMEQLNRAPLLLGLSLACSILPMSVMLFTAAALVTLHCNALAMQAGVMVLVLFAVMYLLYFRFAPQHAYNVLLTPLACMLGIPYVMPAVNGLLQQPMAVIPTICGALTYYFLSGIVENEASLAASAEGEEELLDKFREIINQFSGNKEIYLMMAVFTATAAVIYLIRRLSIDYAWTIAIAAGMLMQFLGFFIGYLQFGMSSKTQMLCIGCAASTVLLFVLKFFCFNLDYTRTERVQFEDDEYYYYVKAVPKVYVSTRQKKIKKISGSGRKADAGRWTDVEALPVEDLDAEGSGEED